MDGHIPNNKVDFIIVYYKRQNDKNNKIMKLEKAIKHVFFSLMHKTIEIEWHIVQVEINFINNDQSIEQVRLYTLVIL